MGRGLSSMVVTGRASVTAIFFLNGVGGGALAARIPALQERVGVSEGGLAVALGALTIGAVVAMPAGGWAITRFGSRPPTRAAILALAGAVGLVGLPTSLSALCLVTLAFGLAMGTLDVTMNANAVDVERTVGRPILSGVHAAFSFGALAGAALGGLAAALGLGPSVHLAVTGALMAAAGAWCGRNLQATRGEARPSLVRPPRKLWGLGVIACACLFAEGAALDWSAVYMAVSLGSGPGLAALAYAAFSLTMATGRLYGDRLVERLGPVALVRAGGVLAATGLGVALVVQQPVAALGGFACLGLGLAALVPVAFRAAAAAPGVPPGVSIAAVSTVGYLGLVAGPPLIGGLAELSSLPRALVLVALAPALVALLARSVSPVSGPPPRRAPRAEAHRARV